MGFKALGKDMLQITGSVTLQRVRSDDISSSAQLDPSIAWLLNPGNQHFGRLAALATAFGRYQFLKLRLRYKPLVGTSTPGLVGIALADDPRYVMPPDVTAWNQLEAGAFGAVHTPLATRIDKTLAKKWYFIDPSQHSTVSALYQAKACLSWSETAADLTLGVLVLDYVVVLEGLVSPQPALLQFTATPSVAYPVIGTGATANVRSPDVHTVTVKGDVATIPQKGDGDVAQGGGWGQALFSGLKSVVKGAETAVEEEAEKSWLNIGWDFFVGAVSAADQDLVIEPPIPVVLANSYLFAYVEGKTRVTCNGQEIHHVPPEYHNRIGYTSLHDTHSPILECKETLAAGTKFNPPPGFTVSPVLLAAGEFIVNVVGYGEDNVQDFSLSQTITSTSATDFRHNQNVSHDTSTRVRVGLYSYDDRDVDKDLTTVTPIDRYPNVNAA